MNYIAQTVFTSNDLQHYGVKGMRWRNHMSIMTRMSNKSPSTASQQAKFQSNIRRKGESLRGKKLKKYSKSGTGNKPKSYKYTFDDTVNKEVSKIKATKSDRKLAKKLGVDPEQLKELRQLEYMDKHGYLD